MVSDLVVHYNQKHLGDLYVLILIELNLDLTLEENVVLLIL